MKRIIKLAVTSALFLAYANAQADEAAVRKAITTSMPSVKIESVQPSEVKGLYEVMVGSNIFYVSDDGKYLLQGRLVDVAGRKDVTEEKLANVRKQALDQLGEDNMIIFKPKIGKYMVSIFTDIDCGYCRKLHSEIDQYMAEGITIRYLLFPRAGKGADSYNKAIAVWCAKDRNAALTAAKKDQKIDIKTCGNPVDKHMQLAADFDAKGTPMIVTAKGNIFPGYLPAKQLAEALADENK